MTEAAQQCIFCLLAEGKIPTTKVYDDNEVMAFLDIKPATPGHIQVIPKMHSQVMSLLPREISGKMLMVALGLGEGLVKKLGATGVTYLINEGKGSGQTVPHASINVIPRYDNDGVTIGWEEKQLNQEEVNKYLQGIIAKLQSGEAPKEAKKETAAQSEKPKQPPINIEERVPKYW